MAFGVNPAVLGTGAGPTTGIVVGPQGLFPDGSSTVPSISFIADTNTGFYRSGTGKIALTSVGTGCCEFSRDSVTGGLLVTVFGTNQGLTFTPNGSGNFVANLGTGYFRLASTTNFASRDATTNYIFSGSSSLAFRNQADSSLLATLSNSTGAITALASTAIPAGGTAASGYMFSSTANFGVFFGSGAPTLSAAKGSLYLRSDGSTTNDRAYINTNGTTTWTAITTVA